MKSFIFTIVLTISIGFITQNCYSEVIFKPTPGQFQKAEKAIEKEHSDMNCGWAGYSWKYSFKTQSYVNHCFPKKGLCQIEMLMNGEVRMTYSEGKSGGSGVVGHWE